MNEQSFIIYHLPFLILSMAYLLVFIGGGIGSVCRLGLSFWLAGWRQAFPWATFLANVLACFVLGVLVGLNLKHKLTPSIGVLLMSGFCGGFSTFSTFSNETFQMLAAGAWGKAAGYIFLSILLCLGSLVLGMKAVAA